MTLLHEIVAQLNIQSITVMITMVSIFGNPDKLEVDVIVYFVFVSILEVCQITNPSSGDMNTK